MKTILSSLVLVGVLSGCCAKSKAVQVADAPKAEVKKEEKKPAKKASKKKAEPKASPSPSPAAVKSI